MSGQVSDLNLEGMRAIVEAGQRYTGVPRSWDPTAAIELVLIGEIGGVREIIRALPAKGRRRSGYPAPITRPRGNHYIGRVQVNNEAPRQYHFVSGLIVLFERPVRIGDTVTVGGVDGRITNINMRATTITDWDNRELLVPNREFITGQVVNWTLSSPVTRVVIPVGIAYGSDTALARRLLLQVAQECQYVMDDPAPDALFRNFGESSLDFHLRVYIAQRSVWPA